MSRKKGTSINAAELFGSTQDSYLPSGPSGDDGGGRGFGGRDGGHGGYSDRGPRRPREDEPPSRSDESSAWRAPRSGGGGGFGGRSSGGGFGDRPGGYDRDRSSFGGGRDSDRGGGGFGGSRFGDRDGGSRFGGDRDGGSRWGGDRDGGSRFGGGGGFGGDRDSGSRFGGGGSSFRDRGSGGYGGDSSSRFGRDSGSSFGRSSQDPRYSDGLPSGPGMARGPAPKRDWTESLEASTGVKAGRAPAPVQAPKVSNAFNDAFGDADDDGRVAEEDVVVKKVMKKKKKPKNQESSSEESESDEESEESSSSSSESDEEDSESDEEDDEEEETSKSSNKNTKKKEESESDEEEDEDSENSDDEEESEEEVRSTSKSKKKATAGVVVVKPSKKDRKVARQARKEGKTFSKATTLAVEEKKKKKKSKLEKAIQYKDAVSFEDLTAGLKDLEMEPYEQGLILTLSKSLEQEKIPLNKVISCLQRFLDDEYVAAVMTKTMVNFHERTTKIKVLGVIKEAEMENEIISLMMVGEKLSVDDFLEKHNLVFIKPIDGLIPEVISSLESKTKPSKLITLIDDKVGENAMPVELTPAIVGWVASKMYSGDKPSEKTISTVSPLLKRCVKDDEALQVQLLFEFQATWFASKPRDNAFINNIFKTLFEEEIVAALSFNRWRETKNAVKGKKEALLKVNVFVTEIQPPPEPEESDEEEYDEEEE